MAVKELLSVNFRNLVFDKLSLHPNLNFVLGDNGSGKSSLLETIFYLGHGKSFRVSNIDSLIMNDKDHFIVSVKTENSTQLGIQRNNQGESRVQIDGIRYSKLSELAKNFAVQIVTPESFKLFSGGPKERRKFIDLGMFHVKHTFSSNWKLFNRIYKQRNALLKNKFSVEEFAYWTLEFCNISEQIAKERQEYINLLKNEFSLWLNLLLPQIKDDIAIQYLQGWNSKKELKEVLESNREKELEKGYSLFGAHKFDVRFLIGNKSLDQTLSRGQQKLFLLALTFAQTQLIEKVKRVKPILLIDDIGAELDSNSRKIIAEVNQQLNCQIVITAIDEVALEPLLPNNNNYKMFHVKHGQISAMSK